MIIYKITEMEAEIERNPNPLDQTTKDKVAFGARKDIYKVCRNNGGSR